MRTNKCGNNFQPRKKADDCVCDIVRRIVQAQNKVGANSCSSGCDSSIHQLLSQKKGNNIGPIHTTIPFMLYCGGTCEPFIGSGVYKTSGSKGKNAFGCVETPIFRANNFVKGSDCCVRLELLVPISEGCGASVPPKDTMSTVCPFFPTDDPITGFKASGICLTVNLDHYSAITCLDPI